MDLLHIWLPKDDSYRSEVLFSHTPDPDLKVKVTELDVKVFKSSYFPNHTMGLFHILFDDRYRSKFLFSNTRAHAYDLKVKVIDLQILIVNILKAHIFWTIWLFWFIFWYDDSYRFRVLFNDTRPMAMT